MLPKSIGSISVPKRQYYGSTDSKGYSRRVAAGDSFATFTPSQQKIDWNKPIQETSRSEASPSSPLQHESPFRHLTFRLSSRLYW
ncbi:MAG: hypothetical protein MET45_21010 [Nostoc sp. LLA-1]|nr:hypothetical protein [Cyanocohniella sp. LLY]